MGVELYNIQKYADQLAEYLEAGGTDHGVVMKTVHLLNEAYVDWSASLDMRKYHLVD